MKCLSVSQPFADLIVTGKKTIELRSWNTKFRGEFLIHAPLQIRTDDCKRLRIDCSKLVTGALIGKAELYNVKPYTFASEIRADRKAHYASLKICNMDKKRYGFEIRNSMKFNSPILHAGQLGFFEVKEPASKPTRKSIILDILNEEHKYRLVGHH